MIERSPDLTFVWGFFRFFSSDLRERIKGSNFNLTGKCFDLDKFEYAFPVFYLWQLIITDDNKCIWYPVKLNYMYNESIM